jgi:hypothetical protein
MLKILLRICIILVAAGIVSAGLIFGVNSSGSSLGGLQGGGQGIREGGVGRQPRAGDLATRPARGFDGGRDGDFGGGFQMARGLQDLAVKIGIIALITAGVAILQRGISWITRKRPPVQVLNQS